MDNQYGVPLVAYEGGQSLLPSSDDSNFGIVQQAENDPRMDQVYVDHVGGLGGGRRGPLRSTSSSPAATASMGTGGCLPNVTAAGSQKYDGVLSILYPAGDANLDGVVDYADFQTLQANYGGTTPTGGRGISTTMGR